MGSQAEKVRHDIETTRRALTDKIEMLETRTQETVDTTKTKFKQTFDPNYHVDRRPWTMVGAAAVLGYALKRLNSSSQNDIPVKVQSPCSKIENRYGGCTASHARSRMRPPLCSQHPNSRSLRCVSSFMMNLPCSRG